MAIEEFDQAGKPLIGVSEERVIDPGADYEFEIQTDPLNFEPGDHELLFTAHRYDDEENDWVYVNNDTASPGITIEESSPDLRVRSTGHPGSAQQGDSITVDAGIRNEGSATAEARVELLIQEYPEGEPRIGVSETYAIDPGTKQEFEFETEQLNFEPRSHTLAFIANRYDSQKNDWVRSDHMNSDIIIEEANAPPVASAGQIQSVAEGSNVELDGTSSEDPNSDSLTYTWEQISGPPVDFAYAGTATPEFTAPEVDHTRELQFELTVSDGNGGSDIDTVEVRVNPANEDPIATTSPDRTVSERESVQLDATASTSPDGDSLRYSWEQISGPSVTINGSATGRPTFTAPEVERNTTLSFELTVSDGNGGLDTDRVEITVEPVNESPIAEAGPDQRVDESSTVQLDGSGSNDPEGNSLSYSWRQISGPSAEIDDRESAEPVIRVPNVDNERTLLIEVTVDDGSGGLDSDTVRIVASPVRNSTTQTEISGRSEVSGNAAVDSENTPRDTVDGLSSATTDETPIPQSNINTKGTNNLTQTRKTSSGTELKLPAPPWAISAGGTLATVYLAKRLLAGEEPNEEVDPGEGHPTLRDEIEDEELVEEINERRPDE
ncbi:PKD domain-containing protein [Halorientalis salina]|uniref:PKD domain-containing protein n=1 Tax=Halorientalis salina TaxID=2932266 RepID=UPI00145E45AE|nr:PKD domain-containing protein [Halorientalis salina]